jgi:hypothetical protein
MLECSALGESFQLIRRVKGAKGGKILPVIVGVHSLRRVFHVSLGLHGVRSCMQTRRHDTTRRLEVHLILANTNAGLAVRTRGLSCLPIQGGRSEIKALVCSGLPPPVRRMLCY